MYVWVFSKTTVAATPVPGTAILHFEMVSRAISSALFDDADNDPNFGPLLDAPNLYTMNVQWRMRARSEAGHRFETNDFNYPIQVCNNCTINTCSYLQPCYPMWANQFMCNL